MARSENECGYFYPASSQTYASSITNWYSWYNGEGRESSRAPCQRFDSIASGGICLRRWYRIIASRDIGKEKSNASRESKAGIRIVLTRWPNRGRVSVGRMRGAWTSTVQGGVSVVSGGHITGSGAEW